MPLTFCPLTETPASHPCRPAAATPGAGSPRETPSSRQRFARSRRQRPHVTGCDGFSELKRRSPRSPQHAHTDWESVPLEFNLCIELSHFETVGFVVSPSKRKCHYAFETCQHAMKVFLEGRGHFGKSCSLSKSNNTCISGVRKMCRHEKRRGGGGQTSDLLVVKTKQRSFLGAS